MYIIYDTYKSPVLFWSYKVDISKMIHKLPNSSRLNAEKSPLRSFRAQDKGWKPRFCANWSRLHGACGWNLEPEKNNKAPGIFLTCQYSTLQLTILANLDEPPMTLLKSLIIVNLKIKTLNFLTIEYQHQLHWSKRTTWYHT